MHKSKIFFFLLIAFILGIAAGSFLKLDDTILLFGIIFSISMITIFWKNKFATVVAFFVFFFVLGAVRVTNKIRWSLDEDFLKKQMLEKVLIIKEPERKDGYQKLTVKAGNDKVLVNSSLYPEYSYGDEIWLECELNIPESLLSKQESVNESFDYRMYLAKDGIKYVCEKAKIEKISSGKGNFFYSFVLKIKHKFVRNISETIPQPEGALASGILFGGSSGMSKQMQDNFSAAGMTHIVAVSGYNVTIIAEYLIAGGILLGLWRKQALTVAILGIFIFVAMIGSPSSAVRAGVMGSVLIWAAKNGRLSNSTNAIIFAGASMLLLNPLLLRWDVGFQLSFLATLGIVQLSPFIEKITFGKKDPTGMVEIIFLTISAQIFVLPVIISSFGSVSLVSLLANMLVLPTVPVSMLFSFLASVLGTFLSPSVNIFAWLAYLPLKYEVAIIEHLSSLSWASVSGVRMTSLFTILCYILLMVLIFFAKKKISCKTEK